MPSFMSSFRHQSASGKARQSTSSFSASSVGKTSVPLHNLCERCRKFSKECVALDWLQRPRGQPLASWPVSRLCSVTQLTQSASSCHFCKMVFAELQHGAARGIRPAGDVGVYACPQTGKSGIELLIRMVLAKGTVRSVEDGKGFALFKFQTYRGKLLHTGFLIMC
jgi:hypothetical protein